MAQDDSTQHRQNELAAQLERIEQLLRLHTARLHAIEERLGVEFVAPPTNQTPASQPHISETLPPSAPTETQSSSAQPSSARPSPAQSSSAPPPREEPPSDATPHASPATQRVDAAADAFAASSTTPSANTHERPAPDADAAPRAGKESAPRTNESARATSAGPRETSDAKASGARERSRAANGRAGDVAGARGAGEPHGEASWFDLESHIGGSWFNWIGILAITFGVAFFLKYAFENEWVGPAGRVLLGAAAGVGILAAGERLRARGLRQYAYVLSGGGILILYLSIYAAFAFYHLIGQLPAFLSMIGVTTTAVLLSSRYDALPIAILGLVGGFLTPLLLSTGRDNQVGLFSYIALLDAGVLALAYYKEWRSLNYMSFAATLLMILGWMTGFYHKEKLWTTIFFLSLFFLLYAALPIVHNVIRQRPARWFDITMLITNASFYFGLSYLLLDDANYDPTLGTFALLVSTFYVLLYYVAHRRHRADRLLTYSLLGAAITFFTMAVSIQLDQHWVTMAWAVEAAVLTWVGLRSATSAPRHAALLVFAVAVGHWATHDIFDSAYRAGAQFTPLLNARAASCAVLVGACAVIVWLYRQAGARIEDDGRGVIKGDAIEHDERDVISTAFLLAANLLVIALLTLDVNDYFTQRTALLTADAATAGDNAAARLENTRQFTLSVLWTLYGATALVLGVLRRLKPLRFLALALLAATIFKVIAFDLAFYAAAWHVPLLNQTFIALMLVVAALAVCARVYTQAGSRVDGAERALVVPVLVVVANVLAIVALSADAYGYFEARIRAGRLVGVSLPDLRLAQQLALSIIWMVYGGAMLVYGLRRRNRPLRVMALLLLGVTTLKVFLSDLSSLDKIYRIIAFLVLGAILLAVSYLYQKRLSGREEAAGVEGAAASDD
ncbi:MAG TPA: DUF2339 domain-containing protein [Pyrinomonadaceae bacterium]|nr:DUF2339 domain-containing protein [Pyrinomonadaceae bacterium]